MSDRLKIQTALVKIKDSLHKYLILYQRDKHISKEEQEHLLLLQNGVEKIEYRLAELDIKDRSIRVLDDKKEQKAIAYNKRFKKAVLEQVAEVLGIASETEAELVQAIAKFQKVKGLDADGMLGDFSFQWLSLHPSGKGQGLEQHVKSDAVLYMGMRSVSRGIEGAVVQQTVGKKQTTLIEGSEEENTIKVGDETADLNSNDGLDLFLDSLINISAAEKAILKQTIKGIGGNGKDEFSQFVQQMNLAENGQKIFKRLILSGHSEGWYIVGDGNEGSYRFTDVATVGKVFPNAFAQVEDLQIAGCNSGQEAKLDQHLAMFPKLKTIWAYADFSPSPYTGSKYHIRKWLKGTQGRGDEKIDAARKDVSNDGGSKDKNVAIYKTDSKEYKTDHSMASWDLKKIKEEIWGVKKYYTQAYQNGAMNLAGLRDLQSLLQAYVGRPEAKSDYYYDEYLTMNKAVLLLRHWKQYNEHFLKHHGKAVKAGYDEMGKAVPDFINMSRKETLKEFTTFKEKGAFSTKTKELIYYYLIELEGDSTWI